MTHVTTDNSSLLNSIRYLDLSGQYLNKDAKITKKCSWFFLFICVLLFRLEIGTYDTACTSFTESLQTNPEGYKMHLVTDEVLSSQVL